MKTKKPYTAAEIREFDRVTDMLSSQNQMVRLHARILAIPAFIKKHGQAKCDVMFEELKRRDSRKRTA